MPNRCRKVGLRHGQEKNAKRKTQNQQQRAQAAPLLLFFRTPRLKCFIHSKYLRLFLLLRLIFLCPTFALAHGSLNELNAFIATPTIFLGPSNLRMVHLMNLRPRDEAQWTTTVTTISEKRPYRCLTCLR